MGTYLERCIVLLLTKEDGEMAQFVELHAGEVDILTLADVKDRLHNAIR